VRKTSFCGCGDRDADGCKYFVVGFTDFYCSLGNRIRYWTSRSDGTYGYFSKYKCEDHIFVSSSEPKKSPMWWLKKETL